MRSYWIRKALNPKTGILIRRPYEHTGKASCEDGDRNWSDQVKECQATTKSEGNAQRKDSPSELPGETNCKHLDFELQPPKS